MWAVEQYGTHPPPGNPVYHVRMGRRSRAWSSGRGGSPDQDHGRVDTELEELAHLRSTEAANLHLAAARDGADERRDAGQAIVGDVGRVEHDLLGKEDHLVSEIDEPRRLSRSGRDTQHQARYRVPLVHRALSREHTER